MNTLRLIQPIAPLFYPLKTCHSIWYENRSKVSPKVIPYNLYGAILVHHRKNNNFFSYYLTLTYKIIIFARRNTKQTNGDKTNFAFKEKCNRKG